jgi:hypothetical protein
VTDILVKMMDSGNRNPKEMILANKMILPLDILQRYFELLDRKRYS